MAILWNIPLLSEKSVVLKKNDIAFYFMDILYAIKVAAHKVGVQLEVNDVHSLKCRGRLSYGCLGDINVTSFLEL